MLLFQFDRLLHFLRARSCCVVFYKVINLQ